MNLKQYLIKISLMFIMAFMVISCGGESNTLASSSNDKLKIETKQSIFDQERNLLSIDFLVKNNYDKKVDVNLEDLSVEVTPCNIKEVSMTPKNIHFSESFQQQYVTALIEFNKECTPQSYNISSSKILTLEDKSNKLTYQSEEMNISPNSNNSTKPNTYSFFNTPLPLTIKEAEASYNFRVQLIDKESRGVSGEEVRILTYDVRYGEIENLSVTTDTNGFANFKFTSIKNLSRVHNKTLTLTIVQGEGLSTISTDINLKFEASKVTPKNYQFKNPSSVVVKNAGESKNISIDIVNSLGIGESGKTVYITTIPSEFGDISSSSTVTNDAGRAIFEYTAPESLDRVNNKSTTLKVSFKDGDTELNETLKITIRKSLELDENVQVEEVKAFEVYSFQNATSITVIKANEEKNISIDLIDSMRVGVAGKTVKISNIPNYLGTFITSTATTNEAGRATFNYIGPKNISNIDVKSIKANLIFINEDDRKIIQPININFEISDNIYIPIDYKLSLNTDNDDFSMGIPKLQKRFTITLKDKKGDIVKNNDVNFTKIHIQTENSLIAQIYNTTNKKLVNELTLKNENSTSFIIKSKKLSGIVPLKATVEFIDINKETKKLSTIINVRVMSGPPSAISISYVSTSQDEARAKYEEKFAISATDEYGNRVNTRPYISLGAIVGYAVDGKESSGVETNDTKRLFYGRDDISNNSANGVIDALGDDVVNTTNFEDNRSSRSDVFKYVNAEGANTDKLVVFGAGKNYEAMGKWDIEAGESFNELVIQDDYFGKTRDKLYYAVGHNYYQDQCQDDGREWIGSTDSESYQLDDQGTVVVSYKYDYHLTGKDALIWVNLNGYQPYIPKDENDTGEGKDTRIGEVIKHTLRGRGLISIPEEGFIIKKGTVHPQNITFKIHHENAPEWYRNANFVNQIEATKCSINFHISSNDFDARTCYNGTGVAYITYNVSAPDENTSCNFNIKKVLVTDEFKHINGKK